MTVRGLVAVAIRLFALWIAVFTFQSVAVTYYVSSDTPFWVFGVGAALGVVAILLLWKFAYPIANRCAPSPAGEAPAALDATGLLKAGACIIGLLTIKDALPELVRAFAWQTMHANDASTGAASSARLAFIVHFTELALGLTLLFGSSKIAEVLRLQSQPASDG